MRTALTQVGNLALTLQEPGNVPTPPEGSYYMFVNIYDGMVYKKDYKRMSTPIANIAALSLPAYADDAAAGSGGLTQGMLYQTNGTAVAPLNVPGIVMIKQ